MTDVKAAIPFCEEHPPENLRTACEKWHKTEPKPKGYCLGVTLAAHSLSCALVNSTGPHFIKKLDKASELLDRMDQDGKIGSGQPTQHGTGRREMPWAMRDLCNLLMNIHEDISRQHIFRTRPDLSIVKDGYQKDEPIANFLSNLARDCRLIMNGDGTVKTTGQEKTPIQHKGVST